MKKSLGACSFTGAPRRTQTGEKSIPLYERGGLEGPLKVGEWPGIAMAAGLCSRVR